MVKYLDEALQYNISYSPTLNPKLFDENDKLYSEISAHIDNIVEEFLDYAEIEDMKILDVRIVGSNASYNFNPDSDLDVHIVTDLSKIANPETIARLYMDSVKRDFKKDYDIKIKGINVELYVEDVNSSANSNGIYSVTEDKWIKKPTPMEDPTDEQIAEAEKIEENIISEINRVKSADELDDLLDRIYLMRKDALSIEGETAPANIAFKSLRNKGILKRANDDLHDRISKELSI